MSEAPLEATAPPSPPRWEFALAFALLAGLIAGLGLADQGLLSELELPVWDRARAANGEPLDGLLRQPWLPERLRALAFARFGPELGLRLPGLLATALTAGCVVWLAQRIFERRTPTLAAGFFYLAYLVVGAQANFAAGEAVLEACIASFFVAALHAHAPTTRKGPRLLSLMIAALALAGAVGSGGIVLGLAMPLGVLALAGPLGLSTRARMATALAAALATAIGAYLVHGQGEGYIPLLGAAKDLELHANPLRREFTATLESFGRELFPFTALLLLGMVLAPKAAWPARWIALGLALTSLWDTQYGYRAVALSVPAALVCAAALDRLLDARVPPALRRLMLLLAIGGTWVSAKDAARTPSRVASPLQRHAREATFPAESIGADLMLEQLARHAWLALLLAYLWAHALSDKDPRKRWQATSLVLAALAYQAFVAQHRLPKATASQLSLREVFARHRAGIEREAIPPTLALHRIRDRGLELYGPPEDHREVLSTRKDARDWLAAEEARVALLRRGDFASLFAMHRAEGWPLHVLDWAHHDLELLANFEAPGFEIVKPLEHIVFDELPPIAHETYVRFDQHLEVVGWQIDGELKRGSEITVTLALRVLRPLSAGTEIHVRLQQGRMSKINIKPHRAAEDLYPANNWRRGDIILDRVTFEIPRANVIPGPHDLFIGIARNQKKNLEISAPEGRKGEFGVTLRGRKGREFANLAVVEIE